MANPIAAGSALGGPELLQRVTALRCFSVKGTDAENQDQQAHHHLQALPEPVREAAEV